METKRLGAVSAYAIAVEHGFVGTEAEWLVSLKGAKGDQGEKGGDYIITEADKTEIADEVESKYTTELGALKQDLQEVEAENAKLKTEAAIADYRIDNLEAAASGKLYREQVLSAESYSDSAYPDTVPYAMLDKVGGKTLVWNNVAAPLTAQYWTFEGNVSGTFNDDGSVTFTNTVKNYGLRTITNRPAVLNHKMYISALVKSEVESGSNIFKIGFGNSSIGITGNPTMTRYAKIGNINQPSNSVIYLWYADTTGTLTVKDLCMVDLTVMFGAGSEPDNVSDPRIAMIDSIFAAHPEHSEPTLMDFSTKEVVSKGRNLVIGILENTNIAAYGQLQELENFDMHYAPVVKGQTYTVRTNGNELVCGFFTDIPRRDSTSFDRSRIVNNNKTVTAPITGYIAFRTIGHYAEAQVSVGTTELPYLPHRGVIGTNNLSALARKYFPDGMKSAGTVHDEIDLENKVAIKRVGSVDLGTLGWGYNSGNDRFNAPSINIANTPVNTVANAVTAKYETTTFNALYGGRDKTVAFDGVSPRIKDTSYGADVASFIAAMSGVMMYYELAEPVITPITEDINPYIAVEGGGTVEFHNDHGDEYLVPVAHQMTYLIKTEA